MSPLAVFGIAVAHVCTVAANLGGEDAGVRLAKRRRRTVGRASASSKAAVSCTGKARHETRADAAIEAARTGQATVAPYACGSCGRWHVGHGRGA